MHNISLRPLLLSCLSALTLAACAIGPDYVRPNIDVPASYKEDGRWKSAQPDDASPRGAWWEIYRDPQLNQLMDTLNKQSPTIEQAEAQYRLAKAQLDQAEASLYPTLGATAGKTHGVSTAGDGTSNSYSLGLNASWEVDLWGAVRRAVEGGKAKEAESVAQLEAVRLSSQSQLATAYLQLVAADVQLQQLQQSEALLLQTLQLTHNQYAAGIVGDDSVASAESQWKTAQAATVDKALTRAQLEHAIAAALGLAPGSFNLPVSQQLPYMPQIPGGIPSGLLERRPDIAAAERSVAVANAEIGIAQSALYPSLTLSASGGYKSSSFADWVSLPNRVWSLGPQLAMTLFDGGALRAQVRQAQATYDSTVASYRSTVLAAFQAVEDNLVAQSRLAEEADMDGKALAAAQRAETITLNQYHAGTVSYLNVLTAQNTRIAAEQSLWNVKNRQYTASVSLIAAIGGKW